MGRTGEGAEVGGVASSSKPTCRVEGVSASRGNRLNCRQLISHKRFNNYSIDLYNRQDYNLLLPICFPNL